jgi:hypothetical protein
VSTGKQLPTFRRMVFILSAGSSSLSRVTVCQSTWHNVTDDVNLHDKFSYLAVALIEKIHIAVNLQRSYSENFPLRSHVF